MAVARPLAGALLLLTTLAPGRAGAEPAGPPPPVEAPPGPPARIEVQAGPRALIEVPVAARDALRSLDVDVEGGHPGWIRGDAAAEALPAIVALGGRVLAADIGTLRPIRTGREDGYHTLETARALLARLADEHPDRARLVDLGTSVEGRELTGLLITDRPLQREPDEPAMRILGTHHGDEWSSMEVTLALTELLVTSQDPAIVDLVDSWEIWVLPIVNPDGVEAFTRRNANSADLNRNYGFQWLPGGAAPGVAAFSEPETRAVRALALRRAFSHSITVHSGASNLGWVWNHQLEPSPDDALLADRCAEYLAATDDPGFWVTNGASWYITHGDTNDWSYGVRGTQDYTLEVSLDKAPPEDELADVLDWHVAPAAGFLVAGAGGVVGRVTVAGAGVEARIDGPRSSWSDPVTGAFARPLPPGLQELTFGGPGLEAHTLEVQVPDDGAVRVDVALAATAPRSVAAVEGLDGFAGEGGSIRVCDPALADADGAELRRGGLPPLPLVLSRGACLELGRPTAPPSDERLEGEWDLVLTRAGAVAAVLPLAVAFADADADFVVETADALRRDDSWVVVARGDGLPVGASLALVGPDGRRRVAGRQLQDGVAAAFDVEGWAEGDYTVRVLGGATVSLPAALSLADGALRPNAARPPEPPPPDPVEPSPTPVPEPAPGMACRSGRGALLAPLALPWYVRRRRSQPPEAP